jgi:hypothetical protein
VRAGFRRGRHAQVDRTGAHRLGALGPLPLAAQKGQGEAEPVDLTVPSLGDGAFAAGEQVSLEFIQAGSIFGLIDSIGQRMQACSC